MKFKSIVGIILILCSIGGMYFWESKGRDSLVSGDVLTASSEIEQGSIVSVDDFQVSRLPKSAILPDTVPIDDAGSLIGQLAAVSVAQNEQIRAAYFKDAEEKIPEGKSYYVIPPEWIYGRSSAMRDGDEINIYVLPDKLLLGTYKVAFVKDASENEITQSDTKVISHVELLCTSDEYFEIYDAVQEYGEASLLLVIDN